MIMSWTSKFLIRENHTKPTYLKLLHLLLQFSNLPECFHHPYFHYVYFLELNAVWPLDISLHCLQLWKHLYCSMLQ